MFRKLQDTDQVHTEGRKPKNGLVVPKGAGLQPPNGVAKHLSPAHRKNGVVTSSGGGRNYNYYMYAAGYVGWKANHRIRPVVSNNSPSFSREIICSSDTPIV